MTLKKTPARLELLQAIADGAVTEQWPLGRGPAASTMDYGPGWATRGLDRRYKRVTAAVRALRLAGLADTEASGRWGSGFSQWLLTDAGRDLLVEWGGKP